MKNVLVLGVGNILMRDDGAGVYIVEKLKKGCTMDNIRLVVGETDIGFCIDEIHDSDYLIIVDAFTGGKEPGEVGMHRLSGIIEGGCRLSPHDIHILDLIAYTEKASEGMLISVEPADISLGLGLSPVLEEKFESIAEAVRERLIEAVQATDDERAKKVISDIRDEEKVHVGELMELLRTLEPKEAELFEEGQQEVRALLSKL